MPMFLKKIHESFFLFFSFMYTTVQIIRGSWKILTLNQPIISIFGGSRLHDDDFYAKEAFNLAEKLSQHNFSIVTGGGPGLMRAAMRGSKTGSTERKIKDKSLGIGVYGLNEGGGKGVTNYIEVNYFWARKYLLTRYSKGIILFPGGFGTLDELGESLTLLQTKKIKNIPIILIGKEFWDPIVQWINTEALVHNLIVKENLKLFIVTDNMDEALGMLCSTCVQENK